jgi:hypothetical protein
VAWDWQPVVARGLVQNFSGVEMQNAYRLLADCMTSSENAPAIAGQMALADVSVDDTRPGGVLGHCVNGSFLVGRLRCKICFP